MHTFNHGLVYQPGSEGMFFLAKLAERHELKVGNPAVATDIGKQHGEWVAKVLHLILKPFFRSPLKGAETSLYLCSSDDAAEISGAYFNNCKVERPKPWAEDDAAAEKLWNYSEESVGFAY